MKPGKDYIGVGCGAVIVNENNEILLQLRNKAPEKEYWSIPSGKVEMVFYRKFTWKINNYNKRCCKQFKKIQDKKLNWERLWKK